MTFHIITIFPEIFDSYMNESILKRASKEGHVEIKIYNLRDYATNKHKSVDDTPYGGGAGMVLSVEPIYNAVSDIKKKFQNAYTILLSAKGQLYTQQKARALTQHNDIILICGRYEGVDERVREHICDEELSIGNFVLTGGELPTMVVIDSISRLLPGVLGNKESAQNESHEQEGVREHPHYTKPESFNNWNVPNVLLSGNHKEIELWRKKNSTRVDKDNSN